MEIRERRDADLDDLERLAARVHALDGYPPRYADHLAALFTRPLPIAAWVAVDGDDVVGHVALHERTTAAAMALASEVTGLPAADLVVLARLLVAPNTRRQGIGRALLDVAVTAAHDRGRRPMLDVATQLVAAVRLYEDQGWMRLGTVTATFSDAAPMAEHVYLGPER